MASASITLYYDLSQLEETIRGPTAVPRTVRVDSITFHTDQGEAQPFFYKEVATLSPLRPVTVIKGGRAYQGGYLSSDSDGVAIACGGRAVHIYRPDSLSFDSPSLFPMVEPQGRRHGRLSYLFTGISWHCKGTALIDEVRTQLTFTAYVQNGTGTNFIADTTLIPVAMDGNDAPRAMMKELSFSRNVERPPVQPELLGEEVPIYRLQQQEIGEVSLLPLFSFQVDSRRVAINTIPSTTVKRGYRLRSPQLLPSCTVDTYWEGRYIGSSPLSAQKKGEEFELLLGESSTVSCKTVLERSSAVVEMGGTNLNQWVEERENQGGWAEENPTNRERRTVVQISATVTIENRGSPNLLLLRYPLPPVSLQEVEPPPSRRVAGYVEWELELPPGQEERPEVIQFDVSLSYWE